MVFKYIGIIHSLDEYYCDYFIRKLIYDNYVIIYEYVTFI